MSKVIKPSSSKPFSLLKPLILLITMSLLPSMASAGGDELKAFQSEIRKKYDMKEAAFAANDPNPILMNFYHADVISTDPDGVTHVGREELRAVYNEVIGAEVRIESYRSFVAGDAGWDWVNFHVTPPAEANQAPFTFKMVFLWAKEKGEWWSHGEMFVVGEFNAGDEPH